MSTEPVTRPTEIRTTDATTKTKATERESIAQGLWRLDPSRSRVEFRTPTLWGLATVKGHFERYEGSLDLQRSPAIELTIDAASLDTGIGFRDEHLRSAAFFDVANHPEVRFVSETVTVQGERTKVSGRLYAGRSSLPLDLDVSLRPVGDEFEFETRTLADHRKLGMSHGMLGMIPTPSELIVTGRLVR
jgi:polyisoprenoid-binding protein YceI